jgi:hypothetical protein
MKTTHYTLTRTLATTLALVTSPLLAQETPPPGAPAEARERMERMMRETRERMQQQQGRATSDVKPWRIGLMVEPIDAAMRNHLELPEKSGVIVTQCLDGGPAARAGIKINDVISAVNGRPVGSIEPLRDSVEESAKTGKELRLSTLHKGQRREVVIKPDMPKPPVDRPMAARPGAPAPQMTPSPMMREQEQMMRRMAEQNKELMGRLEKQQNEVNRLRQQVEELSKGMRMMKQEFKEDKKD